MEKQKERREKQIKQTEAAEKKQPFGYFALGCSFIICGYLLSYNQDFFVYKWIAIVFIIFFILMGMFLLISTMNYYLRTQKELMYIAYGVLILPANYMWYLLWPNLILKIAAGISLFISLYFIILGFMQLIMKFIKEEKNTSGEKMIKVSITVITQVIALILAILQIIFIFK